MEAVIEDVPEYKALWFLDAYDRELYDDLALRGNTEPTGKWKI